MANDIEKKGRRLGGLGDLPESKVNIEDINPKKVEEASEKAGFGKNRQEKMPAAASQKKPANSKPKPSKSISVKRSKEKALVQFNARISQGLREAIEDVINSQEPKWPQAYALKRMYQALCKELSIEPRDVD